MTPEDRARAEIDLQLAAAGWRVQDVRDLNNSAGLGVAVREFPLKSGEADYLLYVDGRVAGIVEAKPAGHPLTGVETQSSKYLDGLPPNLPHYRLPLPFAYESTGVETRFSNYLKPDARSRLVFTVDGDMAQESPPLFAEIFCSNRLQRFWPRRIGNQRWRLGSSRLKHSSRRFGFMKLPFVLARTLQRIRFSRYL